jgi:hypothetical protein
MTDRKTNKNPVFNLDEYEQELSDSYDRGEWKEVDNLEEEKLKARQAAAHYFKRKIL